MTTADAPSSTPTTPLNTPESHGAIGRLIRQPVILVSVLREISRILYRHRRLTIEMARREISDHFVGSYLGTVWSIAHPLIMMAVYVLVFSYVFKGTVPPPEYNLHGFGFDVHMISAYLVWMTVADVLTKNATTISGERALAKQVVFPIEILPAKSVLASLLPQVVGTVFLIVYTVVKYGALPWTWVFWPVLIVCEFMLLCGLAYAVSAIGVFVRDIREVLTVLVLIGFFASPILFTELSLPSENLASILRPIFLLNPASYIIWPFRDVAFHGTLLHWQAWIVLGVGSVLVLIIGYRVFRKLKPLFGNAL